MPAHENLSEYQFRYRPVKDSGPYVPEYSHEVQAIHKETGERVGFASWSQSGNLWEIGVSEGHRRKGVATGMWNHAQNVADSAAGKGVNKRIPMVEHSQNRTESGDAWAKSTGDGVPPNRYL
jgi:hypothetical protein